MDENRAQPDRNAKATCSFTRVCRAFDRSVRIFIPENRLPVCEETCTEGGICDDRPCLWSVANAVSAQARAEVRQSGDYWEEWMANLLRADFPFMVDYTETAWDPCIVSVAARADGEGHTFMADRDAVVEVDCSMARSLLQDCISRTMRSGELVFSGFGISGYDDDPRGLFQIPEVIAWVQACEADMPDLGVWLSPDQSMGWYCQAVFNAAVDPTASHLPIDFYRDWVKKGISAASSRLSRAGVDNASVQKLRTSMYHKAGWSLHEGWGAWFRGIPYQMALAREMWEQHRRLTTFEDLDHNKELIESVRTRAKSGTG